MRRGMEHLLIFLSLFSRRIHGIEAVETALNILSPSSLISPNGYNHQPAQFGFSKCPYNYPTQTCLLNENLLQVDNSLCEELEEKDIPSFPFLILAERRDDCSWVTQARNAQQWGASGLLLADHTCLCSQGEFCQSDNPCVTESPTLSDDGSGRDISIPTLLLEKQDVNALQIALEDNEDVRVKLEWDVSPNQANTVNIEYWHTPGPQQDLPSELGLALTKLGVSVQFAPKFHIVSGSEIGCHPDNPTTDPELCMESCTNGGRYCALEMGGVLGAIRIEETIRRMCIWDLYGSNETDPIGVLYWRYWAAFNEACAEDRGSWQDDECRRAAMEEVGLDYLLVSRCVIQSGGTTGTFPNDYLEAGLSEGEGVAGMDPPSMVVNGVQYQSQVFSQAFGAICASFSANSIPVDCVACVNCKEEQFSCVVNGEICLQEEIITPAPTEAPLFLTTETTSEQPSMQTSPAPSPIATQPNAAGESPAEGENESTPVPTDTPAIIKDGESSGDDGGGGLSDNTKVVIVVAVVGGAIVIIFTFVISLVFKLLKRIRDLEKKGKHTPTSTSPAGSNIWDLPHYVGKEDPFNSDCEPIPPELLEQMCMEAVPNASNDGPIEKDAVPSSNDANLQNSSPPSTPKRESNRGVLVPEEEAKVTRPVQTATPAAALVVTGPLSSSDAKGGTDRSQSEKLKSSGKSELATDKQRTKPRRSSRQNPTLVAIMGKAAPEPKIPKSFSYEDEEKEEIMDD